MSNLNVAHTNDEVSNHQLNLPTGHGRSCSTTAREDGRATANCSMATSVPAREA